MPGRLTGIMAISEFASCSLFALYLLAMNALVGALMLAGVAGFKKRASRVHEVVLQKIAPVVPLLAIAVVFLGLGQLMALDAQYGWLFIGESAQQAWLIPGGVAALLCVALSLLMGLAARKGSVSWGYAWILALAAVGMSAVATTNALTLPDVAAYDQLQAQGFGSGSVNLAGNLAVARLFHFLLSGPAIGGLWLALILRKEGDELSAQASAIGLRWFVGATAANLLVGPWYLFAVPKPVRLEFLGQGQLETGALWFGVLMALAAMHFCRKRVVLAAALSFGSVLLMAICRQRLRDIKLSEAFASPIPHEAAARLWAQAAVAAAIGLAVLYLAFRAKRPTAAESALDTK